MRITHIVIGTIIAVMLHGTIIFAQTASEREEAAKKLYKEGMQLAQQGDCRRAVKQFEQSMATLPNKGSLYNLATCYNKLGKYQKAMAALLQLVREFDADLREEMKESARDQMKTLKERFAWVTLGVDQKGATILIDGRKQGITPLEVALPVEKKSQEISVTCKGFKPWSKRVDFSKVGEARYHIELIPEDGQLLLTVAMDGANVFIDGVKVGVTPIVSPIDLSPGTHRVVVSHSTIETMERLADVTSGKQTRLVIDQGAVASKDVTDDDHVADALGGGGEGQPNAKIEQTFSKQRVFRIGGLASTGVAAASLIAGIITGTMALGLDDDLAKKCPNSECPDGVDYFSDEQKMNNFGAASTVLITAGGIIAAAGITVIVLSYKLDFGESRRIGFVPVLSLDLAGASLLVQF